MVLENQKMAVNKPIINEDKQSIIVIKKKPIISTPLSSNKTTLSEVNGKITDIKSIDMKEKIDETKESEGLMKRDDKKTSNEQVKSNEKRELEALVKSDEEDGENMTSEAEKNNLSKKEISHDGSSSIFNQVSFYIINILIY